MGLYAKYVLPHLIKCACGQEAITEQRKKVVPLAEGRILEIGLGAGHNLPFYDPTRVEKFWGLEPAAELRAIAQDAIDAAPFDVEVLDLPGEQIPLDDNSVDTVMITFTLCTIADVAGALASMRRVLKPSGRMIFCEHGAAPDEKIRKWQNRLTPVWKRLGGGCHLNRDIPGLIMESGFKIPELEAAYLEDAPKILSFNYWGWAEPR